MGNNSVAFTFQASRSALHRGTKDLNEVVTLNDVKEAVFFEQKIGAGAAGVALEFGPVASADAIVIFTTKRIGLHLNGSGAPEVPCGSWLLLTDTGITSVHVDNDLLAVAEDITIEVWLLALDD